MGRGAINLEFESGDVFRVDFKQSHWGVVGRLLKLLVKDENRMGDATVRALLMGNCKLHRMNTTKPVCCLFYGCLQTSSLPTRPSQVR
jgi:hypothetical protein